MNATIDGVDPADCEITWHITAPDGQHVLWVASNIAEHPAEECYTPAGVPSWYKRPWTTDIYYRPANYGHTAEDVTLPTTQTVTCTVRAAGNRQGTATCEVTVTE